jgi:hypothetical protein
MHTVHAHHFATGEGMTYMVLITSTKDKQKAMDRFSEVFHPYYAQGAEASEGIDLDFPGSIYLISRDAGLKLKELEGRGTMIEFHCKFHLNLS